MGDDKEINRAMSWLSYTISKGSADIAIFDTQESEIIQMMRWNPDQLPYEPASNVKFYRGKLESADIDSFISDYSAEGPDFDPENKI
jgi:hypothetical protein